MHTCFLIPLPGDFESIQWAESGEFALVVGYVGPTSEELRAELPLFLDDLVVLGAQPRKAPCSHPHIFLQSKVQSEVRPLAPHPHGELVAQLLDGCCKPQGMEGDLLPNMWIQKDNCDETRTPERQGWMF